MSVRCIILIYSCTYIVISEINLSHTQQRPPAGFGSHLPIFSFSNLLILEFLFPFSVATFPLSEEVRESGVCVKGEVSSDFPSYSRLVPMA